MRNVALLFIASFAPCVVAAQPIQARFSAGVASFVEDGIQNHVNIGGAVRFYVWRRLSVEPEYLYMRRNDYHYDSVLWGNIAYDFRARDRKVVPYIFVAPGLIHGTDKYGSLKFTSTDKAASGGGGVRVFVTKRVFVTPQVRIGFASGYFGEFTGSVGFVLR